jgi:CDGSH-type Zn-finger protein/uncharacterized Fe-S cluster protein YjdI
MKTHEYRGKDISITYDVKRCIHAQECVSGSRDVFNPDRRPWIDADRAEASKIASIIQKCPTGALHYVPADALLGEKPGAVNTIATHPDGPLYVRGQITVRTESGETPLEDVRVALCRCGASKNKPFCDNSHFAVGFQDAGEAVPQDGGGPANASGKLSISPTPNGPLHAEGPARIVNARQEVLLAENEAWLCRCGSSANKPFCDGSHSRVNFRSDV